MKYLLASPLRTPAKVDPYIVEERDPFKSDAVRSSLWEILTLTRHVLPSIATAAKLIQDTLPSVESSLAPLLEKTSDDIFNKEISKVTKSIVLNYEKPEVSIIKSDRVLHYWHFITK